MRYPIWAEIPHQRSINSLFPTRINTDNCSEATTVSDTNSFCEFARAMTELRRPVYTQPFEPWLTIQKEFPSHLEVRRFEAIPESERSGLWLSRRRHTPCDLAIPTDWGLDALYWRAPEEEEYGRLLRNLISPTSRELPLPLSIDMVCIPRSWVPFRWPKPQSPCKLDFSTYTPRGDLPDPDGGEAALDSGWNLRRGSVADGTGDPGRWLREVLKEARDQGRAYAEFVPYHMVEYYRQSPRARHNLYAAIPQWWKEVWVSENMYVPLPPVLTYRASAFLPDKVDDDSWPFYQRVLEAEWTVLVFARWCADIPQRGIMWALSPRLRANLQELGISKLLQGSKYALSDIQAWLLDHDNHPWDSGTQLYAGGGRGQGPSQGARLVEFVRAYPAYRIPLDETRAVAPRGIWAAVVTPMGGSASDGRKSGVQMSDESPRLPAVPRLRSVPLADPLSDCDPYAIESQDLHSGYIRDSRRFAAADPDPRATIPYQRESEMDRDITPSLHRRLEEFRLEATVAYYAPRTMGNVSHGCHGPLSEAAIVECIAYLHGSYTDSLAELEKQQQANVELRRRLTSAEERAERASAHAALMEDAYAVVGREYREMRGGKRPRPE
jgi:hypothetical protein